MKQEAKKFLRRSAVADRYDIGERGVDKWVREGKLPAPVYLAGSRTPLWDLDELVENERDRMRTKPVKQAPQPATAPP
jgi:hypothetical protein